MFAGEEDLGGVGLFRRGTPLGGLPRPDLPRRKAPLARASPEKKTLESPALEGSPGRYRPGNFLHLFRHALQTASAIGVTIAVGGLLA